MTRYLARKDIYLCMWHLPSAVLPVSIVPVDDQVGDAVGVVRLAHGGSSVTEAQCPMPILPILSHV